ncbi:MAG: serine/threonine-protein kinase [Myxococcaceae bacterium]
MLCYRCGSHVPDTAERCGACGQRQVGTARMPSATGLRKKLNPALLAGAPYREGELMANRYLVKDAVGVGPLGFVLRTSDRELGIDVSVKLIHPRFAQTGEEREAFLQALEPARRFLHPSLTRLHDVGIDQGWPYFTYTFLDGLPLRRIIDLRLAKGQTFALDEVEPILGQLMAALEAAHPAGAHGGLKAENILVLPDMLKVTDWGVAAGMPRPPFVQAERQKSAHRHLAPEYLAGLALEPRADVYSLGVLVGEMLTGLTPEDEIPELRLVNPELPDAIEGFYRRALSERPEARFRSVREMFEAYSSVVEGKPLPTPAAPSDAPGEDGFEVDFVETQTVVVQPEPEEPPPPAPVRDGLAAPEAAEATAPLADAEAVEVALQEVAQPAAEPASEAGSALDAPAPEPPPLAAPAHLADAAPAEPPQASPETPFWAEADAPGRETSEPPAGQTLWSSEEDEAEPELAVSPALTTPEAPLLSQAETAPEVAPPPAVPAPVPGVHEAAAEPEAAPPVRPLPAPPASFPRIGSLPPAAVPASRPLVPAIGLWGPGARRTGAHAAVAVAISESSSSVEPAVPSPAGALEAPPPPAVRPVPPPPPLGGPHRERGLSASSVEGLPPPPVVAPAPHVQVPGPSAVRPVMTPAPLAAPHRVEPAARLLPAAAARDAPSPKAASPDERGHRGGMWSPGAALAELVSEVRAEEAGRLAAPESDAAPAAKAAQAVTEQRASRERLALMSAAEEPTAPAPAVSGRPRRVVAAPQATPVQPPRQRPWQKRRFQFAAVVALAFLIGGLAAALLSRVH